jgi:hypothetical protein
MTVTVTTTGRRCPNCWAASFADGRCARCGRPVEEDRDYLDEVESLGWAVVGAAFDENPELRQHAESGTPLQRAIVELANRLRHYHYEGDGCLDE